jgi:alkylation response protein AidB-like acyl-CoA dehydrogenase
MPPTPLVLTEDQRLLAETARGLADRYSPLGRVRRLRDDADPDGFSRALWRQLAELGLVGLPFAESWGGGGLGMAELAVVLEAFGRNLAPEPFLSTILLAGTALARAGTEAQRAHWLPRVAAGEALLALAHEEEGRRLERHRVATRAIPEVASGGWRLDGLKRQVFDGHVADALLVSARAGDDASGLSLFLVRAGAPGLAITRQARVDGRNAALVELRDVPVGAHDLVGPLGGAESLLDAVLDQALVGLCAEMLGAMTAAFEQTVAYLKERVQFGVPIGSFQALKHRAARLFVEIELCRSAVMAAARAADAEPEQLPLLASLAKARCAEAFLHVAEEAIQMHGGLGMTDEHDIGFYLKRARAAEVALGDGSVHRDRWARLRGY